jgi:hypothetical protein
MAMKTTQVHETKPLTSNQQATLQIPVNGKIQSLILRFTNAGGVDAPEANIRAEIGNIRLTVNGRDIINTTVTRLLDLYEIMSGSSVSAPAGVAGVVELNIGRLLFTDPSVRDIFGFGTADVSSIQVTVTPGTLTAAITNVQAFTARQPVNEKLGTIFTMIDYPVSFNGTGDNTYENLPRDSDSAYMLVMADDGASGTITFGEARIGSNTIRERTPSSVNAVLLSNDRMAQPAGYYVYPFCDGSVDGRLPMLNVQDFRLVTTFSVAPGANGYTLTPVRMINIPQAAA